MPPSRLGDKNHVDSDPYYNNIYNNIGVCDRSISVKYRDNKRIVGRVRDRLTFFLDGPSKVIASSDIAYVRCTVAEDERFLARVKAREQAEQAEYRRRFGIRTK